MSTIIGRKQEIEELERLYFSDRAEFVALSAKQRVHLTLITTFGLLHGKHSGKVQKVVIGDDLFTS